MAVPVIFRYLAHNGRPDEEHAGTPRVPGVRGRPPRQRLPVQQRPHPLPGVPREGRGLPHVQGLACGARFGTTVIFIYCEKLIIVSYKL